METYQSTLATKLFYDKAACWRELTTDWKKDMHIMWRVLSILIYLRELVTITLDTKKMHPVQAGPPKLF